MSPDERLYHEQRLDWYVRAFSYVVLKLGFSWETQESVLSMFIRVIEQHGAALQKAEIA